ncbi:setd3 [Scenedesmus sp. PABB004]|nr:setd3 [Scenedesmus sp. PABB004]
MRAAAAPAARARGGLARRSSTAWPGRSGAQRLRAVAGQQQSDVELAATASQLMKWLQAQGAPPTPLEPKRFKADVGQRVGLIAGRDVSGGEEVLEVPEALVVTAVDAEQHALVGRVAAGTSELVGLALWLMAERAAGGASPWAALLATLPDASASPILWEEPDREELLAGSRVLGEARARQAALQQQWAELAGAHFGSDPAAWPPAVWNEAAFMRAFSVVLAHSTYLPAAGCFGLVPGACLMGRTGNDNGCTLDFDAQRGRVVVTATRPYREGQEVLLNDGRPNGELLLSTGTLQDGNLSDCCMFPAALVPADRYYGMKAQLLESFGFGPAESFPVYADRFPIQLLSYLRLSRIQDPGLFAKVTFESDAPISDMNEYEVLQLLMGDCREALAGYRTSLEEDTKLLQRPEVSGRERLAARLRRGEQAILSATMDAVRRRLAPIRGIPTKGGGMADPNADIKEVFDFIDDLPRKPRQLLDGLKAWARGEFDPDWNNCARGLARGSGAGGASAAGARAAAAAGWTAQPRPAQQQPASASPPGQPQQQQQALQPEVQAAAQSARRLAAAMVAAAARAGAARLGAWARRHRVRELLLGPHGAAPAGLAALSMLPALPGGGFSDLFTNRVFLAGFWGWFTAQTLKIFTKRLKKGVWDIRAIVDSGGMPSSHSALCAGITTAIAFQHGLGSASFALGLAFSSIVMYDAAGVRRHAGKQAEVLNQVIGELLDGHPVSDVKLKEVLGHTPLQVCAGAVLGVLFGIFFPTPHPPGGAGAAAALLAAA